jgi:hypothetical protein
MPVYDEF